MQAICSFFPEKAFYGLFWQPSGVFFFFFCKRVILAELLAWKIYAKVSALFTRQPLRAVGVLFSPMVSGWTGGRREIVCPGCISETVRCRKLIRGRDIGLGV